MVWAAYCLGEDEHGTWLYTPQGSLARGRGSGASEVCHVGTPEPPGLHVLHLAPANRQWWFAAWTADSAGRSTDIDICTPPEVSRGRVSYVDLELDVYRRDGDVGIDDLDEFEDACRSGTIKAGERLECLGTARELESRLTRGDDLFDTDVWSQLQAAIRLGLPPLVEVPEP
jgi:hypothetical protein